VDENLDLSRLAPNLQNAHRRRQRIGCADHRDARHAFRRRQRCRRRCDRGGLRCHEPSHAKPRLDVALQPRELFPTPRLLKAGAGAHGHVGNPQPALGQRRLQPRHLAGQSQRPGKSAFRRIARENVAKTIEVRASQRLRPRHQRLRPRRHHRTWRQREIQDLFRHDDTRGQHRTPALRGMHRQRLAQPSARLLGRHDDHLVRKIERAPAAPIRRQMCHSPLQERTIPRQELEA